MNVIEWPSRPWDERDASLPQARSSHACSIAAPASCKTSRCRTSSVSLPATVLRLSLTVLSTASAFRHSRRRSRRTVILPMMMNSLLDRLNDRLAGRTTEITKREPLSDTRTRLVLQRGPSQGLTQNRSLASWVVFRGRSSVVVVAVGCCSSARGCCFASFIRSRTGRKIPTHIRERCCEGPSDWLPPWRWELEEAAAVMACCRWREWQAHDRWCRSYNRETTCVKRDMHTHERTSHSSIESMLNVLDVGFVSVGVWCRAAHPRRGQEGHHDVPRVRSQGRSLAQRRDQALAVVRRTAAAQGEPRALQLRRRDSQGVRACVCVREACLQP